MATNSATRENFALKKGAITLHYVYDVFRLLVLYFVLKMFISVVGALRDKLRKFGFAASNERFDIDNNDLPKPLRNL